MRGGRWRNRWLLAAFLGAALGLWLGTSPAAAQDDGLRIETETTYRVLPDEFAIDVEISYSVTNQVPNRTQGFTTTRTFFSAIFESIPSDAVQVRAVRSNGTALDINVSDDPDFPSDPDAAFQLWEVDLGPNLFYRQTRDLTVTYRLPDGAARDLEAWARVNPAFMAVLLVGRGDDGLATVRLEVPEGFDVEVFTENNDLRRGLTEDGIQRWEIADIEKPYEWSAFVVGSDDEGLERSTFDVPEVGPFAIAAWPGDDEWVEFVTETVTAVGPFLEDATGLEWPHDDPLEIVETVVPSLAGYAGLYIEPSGVADDRFDGLDAIVEIGEDLNTEVLSHEIAHAWFNGDFSQMRWLTEGFAEYFGHEASRAAGIEDPERFQIPLRSSEESFDLLDWRRPTFSRDPDEDDSAEIYGYSASFHLIDLLSEETGDDGMRAVIDVLINDRNPYDTDLDVDGAVDWRRTLDAFEVAGGAASTEELFETWVVGDRFDESLTERRTTLDRRDEVAGHELAWVLPDVIPDLLGDWEFEAAAGLLDDFDTFLDGEVDAIALADEVGVALPTDVRAAFESIVDAESGLDETEAIAAEQREALDVLVSAQATLAEPRGFVQNVGLRGLDPDADLLVAFASFEEARYGDAVRQAEDAAGQVEAAQDRGTDQLIEWALYALAVLVALVLLLWFWRRRRRRNVDPDGEPDDQDLSDADDEPASDDPAPDDAANDVDEADDVDEAGDDDTSASPST